MEDIWLHISRKISGEATDEDQKKVDSWLNENSENKKVYKNLSKFWVSGSSSDKEYPFLYSRLKKRIRQIDHSTRIRHLYIQILKVAASVLVFSLLSFFGYHYFADNRLLTKKIAWNTVSVPCGSRSQILLPDSTKVWINNDSKLTFPEKFAPGKREVELNGEAYFEVKHDENRPFFIKIGDNRIKVLGTTFSVSAYNVDSVIKTSLIRGKVIFESDYSSSRKRSFKLSPGFSLNYNKKTKNVITENIDNTSFYDYWENGLYSFQNEKLETLAKKIYRIYNIQIVFKDNSLKDKTYTGMLSINENIFAFMEAIKLTSVDPIEYQYTNNIIYLNKKGL